MERRSFDFDLLDLEVVCPAGDRIQETNEGPACHCRIEQSFISAAKDPSSFANYCAGAHVMCPTWRAARQEEWKNSDLAHMLAPEGEDRTYNMDDLLEIQAREDAGDFASADVLRREVMDRKRERGLAPGISA